MTKGFDDNSFERDVSFTLGEHGPAPRRDELVEGEVYILDGIASTDLPCTSLAGIALSSELQGKRTHKLDITKAVALVGAEVEYIGLKYDDCGYGCSSTLHHEFKPVAEDLSVTEEGIPVTFYALDGMFTLADSR